MEDITYLQTLSGELRDIVLPAYVKSFHRVNGTFSLIYPYNIQNADNTVVLGLICAGISFVIAIFTRGRRLSRKTSVQVVTD